MCLKRPHAVAFNKKNDIHPFDTNSTSIASLEFWSAKNDASLFVIGQTTKKRPHGLTFVRMYDGKVLDMVEVGVDNWVSMANFKVCLRFCVLFKMDIHACRRQRNQHQGINPSSTLPLSFLTRIPDLCN